MTSEIYASPEHEAFRGTVRKFVQEELAPRAREFDAAGRIDKSLYRRMGELGMLGIRYEPRWGGSGLDWSYSAVLFEELARSDNAGVTMGISAHTVRNILVTVFIKTGVSNRVALARLVLTGSLEGAAH